VFGFEFRNDCLFGIDSVFEDHYERPLLAHPILQQVPYLDFATSCSIDPGRSAGRAVIRGGALKSLMADYHSDNFYPLPDDQAEMRYGTFVQLWATRHGRGRVLGFTDSTIFSNFSAFEPGKSELMLGMIQWLNHRSRISRPRALLVVCGVAALIGSWRMTRRRRHWIPLPLAFGIFGWSAGVLIVLAVNRTRMPELQPVRPLTRIVIDRTVCEGPLSRNGFIAGSEEGFGIFERWILRLGYFTARRASSDVFDGDVVVFLAPTRPPRPSFTQALTEYVSGGGKLLVIDSLTSESSTANQLLRPFGLRIDRKPSVAGNLRTDNGWPEVPVGQAAAVHGGKPLAWIGSTCVGAHVQHGAGHVTAISFGSRLTDASMGGSGDVIPNQELKQVFAVQFALVESVVRQGERQAGSRLP
jgi:hypothetical protein